MWLDAPRERYKPLLRVGEIKRYRKLLCWVKNNALMRGNTTSVIESDKKCFIHSHENKRLNNIEWILKKNNNSKIKYNVIIIRDVFNAMASTLERWEKKKVKGYKTEKNILSMLDIYEEYYAESLNVTNYLDNKKVILYNSWVSDKNYRYKIAKRLGIKNTITSLGRINRFGGGSSFDNNEFNNRYKMIENTFIYDVIMSREKLIEYNNELFGVICQQ